MKGTLVDGKLNGKGTWKDRGNDFECTFVDNIIVGLGKFYDHLLYLNHYWS